MSSKKDQIIAGIVCAVVLGAYALLVARPQSRALAAVRGQTLNLSSDIRQRQTVAESTAALERDLQASRVRLGSAAERIPSTMRLGELIAQLSAASDEWGLRGTDVSPARPYQVDRLQVLPIEVTFECEFPSLFGFLQEIESLTRIVRVSDLRAQRKSDEPSLITCELMLHVYSEIH